MELTLIRHAIAVDGPDDAARPLSKKGRRRFEQSVKTLDELGFRFDKVLHSPKVRAVETAELLAPLCDGELASTALLARAPDVALWELLEGDRLAVVGHEPHLSSLLSWLVTGEPTGGNFELKKGAVAQLVGEPGPAGMKLRSLLQPRVLRR
ncbi:MAG: histidine phosphatase family protein [Archangium sp.]|nr:histidine phosphatase family protein [Archangium sp.]